MLYGWELLNKEEEEIIAKGIMDGKVYGGPFHLVLFPSDRCNLNCFFCYATELRQVGDELDWEVLKRTLEEGVRMGVKGISFGGGGEPLIYKHFKGILDFIEEHSLNMDIVVTNGTAITPDVARRFIKYNLQTMVVSLNETTPERYAQMSQSSVYMYEKAMNGIRNIIRAKNETASNCEIRIQIFVWKENYKRLEEMISSLLETGTDAIYIATIDELPLDQRLNDQEKEELKELIRNVMKKWAHKIQTHFVYEGLDKFVMEEQYKFYPQAIDLPNLCKTQNRIEYCNIGWYSLIITGSGNTFPCCQFWTNKDKSFGNLNKESLGEIWYGEKARRFRTEMRHLLLTEANKELLPRKPCFISPLCLERSACAFNYYLSSPEFYFKIQEWAESGPRKNYIRLQQLKASSYKILRKGKRLVKNILKISMKME